MFTSREQDNRKSHDGVTFVRVAPKVPTNRYLASLRARVEDRPDRRVEIAFSVLGQAANDLLPWRAEDVQPEAGFNEKMHAIKVAQRLYHFWN